MRLVPTASVMPGTTLARDVLVAPSAGPLLRAGVPLTSYPTYLGVKATWQRVLQLKSPSRFATDRKTYLRRKMCLTGMTLSRRFSHSSSSSRVEDSVDLLRPLRYPRQSNPIPSE